MLLKDSVTVFVKRTSDEDRYRPEFRRYELHDVMFLKNSPLAVITGIREAA